MSYTTSVTDLRNMLADNSANRLCHRKKCFGDVNGVNRVFKTFEGRRVTNFTTATAPLGVYVGGVLVAVDTDDGISGEFVLHTAPTDTGNEAVVQASYYHQWFIDTELQGFLNNAALWLALADITAATGGLIPAALQYAAGDALRFRALQMAERASNTFLLEDKPKKEALGLSDSYMKLADSYMKQAEKLRNSFYTKSGQALAATSKTSWGRVSAVTPRR